MGMYLAHSVCDALIDNRSEVRKILALGRSPVLRFTRDHIGLNDFKSPNQLAKAKTGLVSHFLQLLDDFASCRQPTRPASIGG